MTTVNPTLAKFAVELSEIIDKLFDKYSVQDAAFYEIYEPEIRLYTTDGLTAKFYEEGIEFYPKKEVQNEV